MISDQYLYTYFTILFLALSVYWTVTDPRGFFGRTKNLVSEDQFTLRISAIIVTVLYLGTTHTYRYEVGKHLLFFQYAGIMVFTLGAALCVWAKIIMGKYWGIPGEKSARQNKLVTHGPFKYSRNPIYLGLLQMFIGMSVAFHSYSIFICYAVYWGMKQVIIKEEIYLRGKFGEEYEKYLTKVNRFL